MEATLSKLKSEPVSKYDLQAMRDVMRDRYRDLLDWSPAAAKAPFADRYAAICLALRELFEDDGRKPPMLLFEDSDGLFAFSIDDIGHTHHVHRTPKLEP